MRSGSRMTDFTAGAIAVVACGLALFWGFTKANPFHRAFEIKAAFESSNNLKTNSPVRIAGVEVGKVKKVEPVGGGAEGAVVTMEIFKRGQPIHKDARAKIRPRIFLEGNFFVDLRPGSPSAPVLDSGDTIPVNQTAIPVQLDQVFQALDGDTRGQLRTALTELASAYDDGAAGAFNRSLEFQPDAYRFTAVVSEALLGREAGDLGDFVRDMGRVSAAVDRNPRQLQGLLRDFNITAGALARESGALQAAIAELPRTLRAAGPTLDALNAAFPSVRRLAVEALPGVRSSSPTIQALRPLIGQLRGLVSESELRGLSADLGAATPPLASTAESTVPLLAQLRPLASCAANVVIPALDQKVPDERFPATGPAYQEFFKALVGLAGESRSFDANNQWFKVLGAGGRETFGLGNGLLGSSAVPFLGTNPPKAKRRPPLKPDVPCETQEPPDLGTKPGGAPARVNARPDSAAARARSAKAREVAIGLERLRLDREGSKLRVLERDITRAELRDGH